MARISKYERIEQSGSVTTWRAGLYIRLSREDGDKLESESISSQRAIIDHYLNGHADILVYDSYIDDGFTGTDFDRPAFRRMLKDITDQKVNCVIVKDLSRFGRNYIESGKYLETVFPLLKVRFIAINDAVDSVENPASVNSVMLPFKNIMNDEYCRDISAKVRSSLTARRFQGKFIGSSPSYGYQKDPNDHNKLIVDREAANVVRRIYRMFLAGNSILGITRHLNDAGIVNPSTYKREHGINKNGSKSVSSLWIDTTVRRILSNRMYVGDMVQKRYEVVSYKIHVGKPTKQSDWIIVENTHEAIISREDFENVQALLKRDTRVSSDQKLSVFAGFLKCADCGRAMNKKTIIQPYKRYDYYVCSTYKKFDRTACTKHTIRSDVLEKAVLTTLNQYITFAVDYDELSRQIDENTNKESEEKRLQTLIRDKQREAERARKLLLELYPDYKDGILSREQYISLKEKYEANLQNSTAEIDELKKQIQNISAADVKNRFIDLFKSYRGLAKLTREAVCELIENIFVREGGEIEIHLKCRDAFASMKKFLGQNNQINTVPLTNQNGLWKTKKDMGL